MRHDRDEHKTRLTVSSDTDTTGHGDHTRHTARDCTRSCRGPRSGHAQARHWRGLTTRHTARCTALDTTRNKTRTTHDTTQAAGHSRRSLPRTLSYARSLRGVARHCGRPAGDSADPAPAAPPIHARLRDRPPHYTGGGPRALKMMEYREKGEAECWCMSCR